ncbi:hypothetical protein KAR91_84745, partial [Candidatus Pacearchaeota archaeon]|nr:hypothetical protein [Candidatus Pacearchaeota archaeon]
MRIISDFHDYYDCVQAQGQDQSVVWVRKKEDIELENYPFPQCQFPYRTYGRHRIPRIKVETAIIGFCGKIYPVITLEDDRHHYGENGICYTLNEIDEFIET